jgi:hypothetical protein
MRARTELMLWGGGRERAAAGQVPKNMVGKGPQPRRKTTPSYLEQESPFDAETDGLEDVAMEANRQQNAPVSTPRVVAAKKSQTASWVLRSVVLDDGNASHLNGKLKDDTQHDSTNDRRVSQHLM